MHSIIIRQPYIGLILDGQKTWEMRSTLTLRRGQIGLIHKGTKTVVGVANIVDCIGPLTDESRLAAEDRHCVSADKWADPFFAKYRFAWVLTNARRLIKPVPYKQTGPVIWITLNDEETQNVFEQIQ
jgi:hypothetical protein